MNFSINTNAAAMNAAFGLKQTTSALEETQMRINTGLNVRSAKDNGALYAISQNLKSDRSSLEAVKRSLDRSTSAMNVTLAAGESISDLITRARELAAQGADLAIDTETRDAIANDFKNIMKQIDIQARAAEFNGTNLIKDPADSISAIVSVNSDASVGTIGIQGYPFGSTTITATEAYSAGTLDPAVGDNLAALMSQKAIGSLAGSVKNGAGWHLTNALSAATVATNGATVDSNNGNITITTTGSNYNAVNGEITFTLGGATFKATTQANLPAGQVVTLKPDQFTVKTAGAVTVGSAVTKVTGNLDLKNLADRMGAIAAVDSYHDRIKARLAIFGSAANQLEMQRKFADKLGDSVDTGIGNIIDADMAVESARLKSLQIRQQLGTQALSIANSAPEAVLSLFRS